MRAVSAPRSRCSLPHPPPSPAPGVRVPLLARAFRCWSQRCAEAAPLLHSYSTPYRTTPAPYRPRSTQSPYSAYLPSLLPSYLPLHQSPSLLQAAEAAHEARLHEATQGLEAELRALEAASLSSEARHV